MVAPSTSAPWHPASQHPYILAFSILAPWQSITWDMAPWHGGIHHLSTMASSNKHHDDLALWHPRLSTVASTIPSHRHSGPMAPSISVPSYSTPRWTHTESQFTPRTGQKVEQWDEGRSQGQAGSTLALWPHPWGKPQPKSSRKQILRHQGCAPCLAIMLLSALGTLLGMRFMWQRRSSPFNIMALWKSGIRLG